MTDKVESFWQEFLRATGRSPETEPIGIFSFDITEESANALLELVLSGKKRATSSSLPAYELDGEPIPKAGDLSIVTDWAGNPRCVIMTKEVTIIPYKDMTFDICSREGEDECLESWQRNHERFFTHDAKESGYAFSPDMPVVFEDFEMIYKTE